MADYPGSNNTGSGGNIQPILKEVYPKKRFGKLKKLLGK